ncbi:MAG: sigma-70 family RNA polymerase sigma factor [Planctomycetes bacterium]|nr:sigma-70 family RNA polymerase sigma factor [Planctomycetota bacterium]
MEQSATRLSLIARVRDPANGTAWAEFEQRYRDLVQHYALARGLQFCDAEDVCQIVFFRLSKYLRSFSYSAERGRFRSYLGAVVRNVIFEQKARPHPRGGAVDADDDVLEAAPDPHADESDEAWEQEWVNHHCRTALATIRQTFEPRSVEVFEALLAGAAPANVAAERGLSLDAVVKIRQRVRARMQELIQEQIEDEDVR